MKKLTYITFFCLLSLSSCYNDSEENLYPNLTTCDTVAVSYNADLNPILQNRCYSCHGNNNTISSIDFEGYSDLIIVLNNRNLIGAIKRVPGVTAMPLGGEKIPDCEIKIIESWINQGKLNN